MARTVGRGVENKTETLESVKLELDRVNNVGLELIKVNEDLKEKNKQLTEQNEELIKVNEDLNAKLVKAEEKLKKLKTETDK